MSKPNNTVRHRIRAGVVWIHCLIICVAQFSACVPPKPQRPGRIKTPSRERPSPDTVTAARARSLQSRDPELKLINEAGRTYGVYRLKPGEALYSSVVVRFTGRVDADEVNALARELMALNGIQDETRIPAGTEIRIPLQLIDEALLAERAPMAPRRVRRRGRTLHVILDAGHGGNDPGTIVQGWREADIAYDLMRRVASGLARQGVKVMPLVSAGNDVSSTDGVTGLSASRHQFVNVSPQYQLEDSRVGLNLRICLVDEIYSRLIRQGVAPEDILFLSIHLDHLHPSVNGTMVYIPGAGERQSFFRANGSIYARYRESRGHTIRFDPEQNREIERTSEVFARALIKSLRRAGLPIHTYEPIRRYVYRRGKKWTPGIIRYSRVPTSILLEAANLSNHADLKRVRSSAFRQRLADSVVRTILSRD